MKAKELKALLTKVDDEVEICVYDEDTNPEIPILSPAIASGIRNVRKATCSNKRKYFNEEGDFRETEAIVFYHRKLS